MKFAKPVGAALAVLMLSVPALDARAALNAVDPGPYSTALTGGFPLWYQDFNGRALELCLSATEIAPDPLRGLVGGAGCTLLPNPGVFDPAQPMVFPTNFPDESFWFMGDATFQNADGSVTGTYVSNLEAAFGGGNPAPGDQISFARIRIRITLPDTAPPGVYTVTHPYGVERYDLLAGGIKVINMTRDIGIGAPGDFTGALAGDLGPFLMDASVPTLGLIPGVTAPGAPPEFFIGDPNTARPVVGSPFGTNFVRLQAPDGSVLAETNLFAVMGKVFGGALPTPLAIERTTYSRSVAATQQDVFAKAPPTSNAVTLTDTAGVTAAMTDGDANGGWFGQTASAPTPLALVSVSATNTANNNTLSSATRSLVDLVTISRAEYSAGTLTVEAVSSDEVQVPTLSIDGRAVSLAPVIGQEPLQRATFPLAVPPARVTVTSTSGGSDTEEVIVLP